MSSVISLRNYLEMFQQAFSNALTEDSPIAEQPSHIKTNLKIHQLAAIYAMREKEISLRSGFKVPGTEETLFSQYAFLGDRVGVGKTFMILGHISQMAKMPLIHSAPLRILHESSTSSCFSIIPEIIPKNLYNSLVIVPHTIYRQWQDTIKIHTTLKVLCLKTLRDLEKDTLVSNLETSHLTLISNTLLTSFMNSLDARNIIPKWRRVVYDEVDTIYIKNRTIRPTALMTWYVTATYTNFLLSNQFYHSHIIRQLPAAYIDSLHPILKDSLQLQIANHPNVRVFKTHSHEYFKKDIASTHPLRGHLIVMNSDTFLDYSVILPNLTREIIRCDTPITQRLVESAISQEIQDMLHAGDIQGAFQVLGINSHSPLTIVEAVTEYKTKELERLERLLVFKRQEDYASEQSKELALAALQVKIHAIKHQIKAIKERIEEASKDGCSICFDAADGPVLTPCCAKVFCANCILSWMQRTPVCPLCRTTFHPSQLCAIGHLDTFRPQKTRLPKKMEALLNIINANPNGKFLIFSRYENPLYALYENLETIYRVGTLQGNKDVIANMLEEFGKGNIKILLLNSCTAAAGINIQMATHVILLHKMVDEEEQQIMGRAYRMGRIEPLHFIKLLNEHE